MQSLETFFNTVQENDLPFVVYRKPGEKVVKAYFQKDKALHFLKDFDEEGFVFAPFRTDTPTVLFPLSQLEEVTITSVEALDVILPQNRTSQETEKQAHIALVEKGINTIQNGDMEKVVLSRKHTIPLKNSNPYEAIVRLLSKYTTAFVYCWYHPTVGLWLGATPETLLTIKNRQLETMALAGTKAYTGTLDVNWGEKEKREQELVTQAIVNNLNPLLGANLELEGPVSAKAGNLVHLKTKLTAKLNTTEVSLKDIVQALHPTPAICGYPREAAKTFINENEAYDREYYTGYLGELNMKEIASRSKSRRNVENLAYQTIKKTTSLFVNLRCMQWVDNQATIYVGGGITKGSDPKKEWEEIVNKLQTMLTIL